LYAVGTPDGTYEGALIVAFPNACQLFEIAASHDLAGAEGSTLILTVASTGDPAPPGTYTIGTDAGGPYTAEASAGKLQWQCGGQNPQPATAGTITIEKAGPDGVSGTFDVQFYGGYHLAGDFAGPVCGFPLHDIWQSSLWLCHP
jgi:hypothetical protein